MCFNNSMPSKVFSNNVINAEDMNSTPTFHWCSNNIPITDEEYSSPIFIHNNQDMCPSNSSCKNIDIELEKIAPFTTILCDDIQATDELEDSNSPAIGKNFKIVIICTCLNNLYL